MENRKLRNIGIIAHVDAGKTTLSERILFYTGKIHRFGEVHHGATTLDFDPQEQKRGITINSAATSVSWGDCRINLIDTPGHIDFNIEVKRALRVLDGAVVVFDGVAGVEPQTETNWRLADEYGVPRLAFVNKLDRVGADFDRVLRQMRERLGVLPQPLQWPVGVEAGFEAVVDLVEARLVRWPTDDAAPPRVEAIPEDLVHEAEERRRALVELAVEADDELLERYLAGETIMVDELRRAIRRATLDGRFVPVLCGSAMKNRGIEPLLDAVVDYLPAPEDVGDERLSRNADGPFAALAFKVVNDDHGSLTFVRVYRGRIRAGSTVINVASGQRERLARLYEVHADTKREREEAVAGDIVAVGGLKATVTGDTLADAAAPVLLERIEVPEPVIDVTVEVKQASELPSLQKALQALTAEDPSLRVRTDEESGQCILSGMGELQLEVAVENLRTRHKLEVRLGRPRVSLRETVAVAAEVRHLHKKQTGGPGQYAEVALRVEPLPRGEGFVFDNRVVGGAIPREFIPAVEVGVRRSLADGIVAGCALVDVRVTLLDGSHHANDSSSLAFELAAAAATKEAARKASPQLLEPWMAVETVTPAEFVGTVIGDIGRRRGRVRQQEMRGTATLIRSEVPLREMFGYIGDLRAQTSGRAGFSMTLERYEIVPAALAVSLTAER